MSEWLHVEATWPEPVDTDATDPPRGIEDAAWNAGPTFSTTARADLRGMNRCDIPEVVEWYLRVSGGAAGAELMVDDGAHRWYWRGSTLLDRPDPR